MNGSSESVSICFFENEEVRDEAWTARFDVALNSDHRFLENLPGVSFRFLKFGNSGNLDPGKKGPILLIPRFSSLSKRVMTGIYVGC